MHLKTQHIATLGLSIACFLFLSTLNVNPASAASATITTNTNITLDTSSAGNGVTIDEESINITTTCNKGYDLTIATSTSTNLYLNGDSTKTAAYTAVDGTSALNSSNNTNKWGYTLTSNATSSTVFSPLSTTATSIRTISQTTDITSETIPIYYGIKTDNTVDPGTYSMGNNGVITYYLTMNPLCNVVDIAYDGNNADEGTMGAVGTGVIHTGKKDGDTINLITSNFSRSGYGFAGWSLDPNAGTKLLDNDNTNNPIVYGPQETITLPEGFTDNDTDNDGIIKLYAVWLQSQGNLQGWAGCANLDIATYDGNTGALDLAKNSVTALTDQRDNDTYAVARLADGNCWMIENLRLDNDASHNSDGLLAQGYGASTVYGNFSGLANSENSGFSSTYIANSLYYSGIQEGTASINIGTLDAPAYRMPRYNNLNTANRASNPTDNADNMYSYGNYYTWHAAMANTTHYNSPTATDADGKTSETVNTSLCPTGWRLPYGRSTGNGVVAGGFSYLDRKLGGTGTSESTYEASLRWRRYPVNFISAGDFASDSIDPRSAGYYWSSTTSSYSSAYGIRLWLSGVNPGTHSFLKHNGWSVRCVVPSNLYAVHYDANTIDTVTGVMPIQSIARDETVALQTNAFQRPATSSSSYHFIKWNTKPDGTGTDYVDGTSVTNLAPIGEIITLYAQWEQVTPMTVNFDGNGLSFPNAANTNTVYYYNGCVTKYVSSPSYSHTSNINNDGTQIGTTKYDNNLATKDVITIPGAESLHVTITYGTENNYDMLYVFQGEYTGSVTMNMSAGQLATYMGGNNTTTTVELDIPGNTATFAFYSDSSAQYWGYHASVVGYYDTEPASYASTAQICSRSHVSGEYKTPDMGSLRTFYGWSENQSATTADYVTANEVLNNLPGNNGETKTLYAIWRNNLTINYNANGGTGTTASQTVAAGETITLKSNSFTAPANTAFGGWNTEPDGTGTSYSANTTFTAPNSVAYNDSLTLYVQWLPQYTITYVNNCQTYASANSSCTQTVSGSTDEQKIDLTNNPSTGTETGALAAYNKWTLTGWKIKGWSTVADNSDNTNTEYSVGTTYTVPAGSSVGSGITLYAHWVPVYSIQYDGNDASNTNGMGTLDPSTGVKSVKQTNVSEGDLVTLLASNFKKPGYGFAGWSTNPNATVTSGDKIYGPMETISAPAYPTNGTNIITMYAVWVPAEKSDPSNPSSSPLYLQDFTASNCNAMTSASFNASTGAITSGSVIALTDKRDNEVYTIAKLADDNCWMIENLRLEHAGTVGNNINDPSITNESLSQGYGGTTGTYGNFVGLAESESANFSSTTSNSIYKSDGSGDTYVESTGVLEDIGTTRTPLDRFPRYNNSNTKNLIDSTTYTQNYGNANSPSGSGTYIASNLYSYGNYYSWAAAIANTNYYHSPSTSEAASTSICPAGWYLPSSGSTSKDFGILSIRYGGTGDNQDGLSNSGDIMSNRFRSFPNNFLLNGYFTNRTTPNSRGSLGGYWSKTADSNYSHSYYLFLGLSGLLPSDIGSGYKYDGEGVRCLIGS